MSVASSSKAASAQANSRADYLKKYLSGASKDDSKPKKSKKKDQPAVSGRGMRLLEEDTFLPLPPPEKKFRMPTSSIIDMTNKDRWDEEDDEDELAIFNARKNPSVGASKFKTDSFVTIIEKEVAKSTATDSPPPSHRTGPKKVESSSSSSSEEDNDNSPVRRGQKRRNTKGSDGDMSPPRRMKREQRTSDSDRSPPRRNGRQRDKKSSSRDISPPRNRRTSETKASRSSGSPMRIKQEPGMSPEFIDRKRRPSGSRMSLSPKHIKKEPGIQMEEDHSGRNADTRKRVTLFNQTRKSNRKKEEDEDPERKERESKKQQEMDDKYKHWNKGVAQLRQREEKIKEMEETVKEGFSRYADNEAMNEHLMEQLHEDDPMADYFKTKKHKVQMRSGIVYPKYQSSWPPNRFSIPPGYRWDGVNRSNGFEEKMALTENKRKAQESEAYKSIVECEE